MGGDAATNASRSTSANATLYIEKLDGQDAIVVELGKSSRGVIAMGGGVGFEWGLMRVVEQKGK